MKKISFFAFVLMLSLITIDCFSQNGGLNTARLTASESLRVGTVSDAVVVFDNLISLPALTNSDINSLGINIEEGALVYASDSDVLIVFDGTKWKRVDGGNDNYLTPSTPVKSASEPSVEHGDSDDNRIKEGN